jgi:hypothetical protein
MDFKFAGFDDFTYIKKFLNDHWAKNHIYVRNPELFNWSFHHPHIWDQEGYSFALALEKEEIVGILGGVPFRFNCFGQISKGIWLVNWMLRPDFRRGLVSLQLQNMFRRKPFETFIGFGNKPSVVPLYRARGFKILHDIPRHFVVLPQALDRMKDLLSLTYPEWPLDRVHKLASEFQLVGMPEASEESQNSIPTSWNQQGWSHLAKTSVGAARDYEYLKWRYLDHPLFQYRVISLTDGERIGILVWRLETIHRTTQHGVEEVDRLGRVVEFLPFSAQNAKDLISHLYLELDEESALGADFYGFFGQARQQLEKMGFRSVDAHPDGGFIPSRFQPLDERGGQIGSAVLTLPGVPDCSADLSCQWYWTKSDSDQDRPN